MKEFLLSCHIFFNFCFWRNRINLNSNEIRKLIIDQYEILQNIAIKHNEKVSHIKPHGALNNMACEDIELATTLAKAVKEISKNIIYVVGCYVPSLHN